MTVPLTRIADWSTLILVSMIESFGILMSKTFMSCNLPVLNNISGVGCTHNDSSYKRNSHRKFHDLIFDGIIDKRMALYF